MNPAIRTLTLKPLIPSSIQLRVHEECESPVLRIYFSNEEIKELSEIDLPWKYYECGPKMTRKCLVDSGFASVSHDHWANIKVGGQKRKIKVVVTATLEKEQNNVLRFRLSAELQSDIRRNDGQPAQVLIKRDEALFEEARVESVALDASMKAYHLVRKVEYRQCPWITTGLRELLGQFYDILEVKTEVYTEDENTDENVPRKSRFEMVLRDPLEQQAQMDVLRELLSILPKVWVVGGLAPRIDFLKSVLDGLKGFHQELQEKIDAERKARQPKRGRGRQPRTDKVDELMRSFGFDPKDAEAGTKDQKAQTEPAASEAATVEQPVKAKSFKELMTEKAAAKKAASDGKKVDSTPRTIADQLKKLVPAVEPPPTPPVALAEPVPPVVEPAPSLEPSEPASPES